MQRTDSRQAWRAASSSGIPPEAFCIFWINSQASSARQRRAWSKPATEAGQERSDDAAFTGLCGESGDMVLRGLVGAKRKDFAGPSMVEGNRRHAWREYHVRAGMTSLPCADHFWQPVGDWLPSGQPEEECYPRRGGEWKRSRPSASRSLLLNPLGPGPTPQRVAKQNPSSASEAGILATRRGFEPLLPP